MKDSFDKFNGVDSRVSAMVSDLVTSRAHRGGRIFESSFKRIPSVKAFKVKVGMMNEALLGTGLERRMKPDFKLIVFKEQDRANKYMEARLRAMRAALSAGRPKIFWAMAMREMKHSVCFRTSAFNAVFPGWYKNMDFNRAVQIAFGVEHIIRKNLKVIKYFRVEIPKGSPEEIAEFFKNNPNKTWPGKMRPLGVPTASWRVVLHMWNGFLTMFLEEELKQFNHAYMPKVGTITAIKSFIENVRDAKFIYEFDIKGFFNNVNILKVIQALRDRGMPTNEALDFRNILCSAPINLDFYDKSTIKTDYDKKLAIRNIMVNNVESPLMDRNSREYDYDFLEWDTNSDTLYAGLPQGAAPSTILSILALADWFKELKSKGINLLMYADDGMLYSDTEFEPFPPNKFEFAEEKSGWVKGKENKEEIKFLGVIYNFKTKLLKGATRSGSTLEFGLAQTNLLEYLRKIVPGSYTDMMGALVRSNVFGLALSKLYGGKFGKLQYSEDVKYHPRSYWARYHNLTELKNSKTLEKTASTTSCGWLLLLNNHVMCKSDKDEFFNEARRYHELRPWEISEKEIKAALEWQFPWDRDPNWFPHYGYSD